MSNILKLPGLIDTHVHLREPGGEQKEDFETGTKAAVAGGYTLVLDMPNNPAPVINEDVLKDKIKRAQGRIYADLGFHFGGSKSAILYFNQVKDQVFGLKVYMNHTTGPLLVEDDHDLEMIFMAWPKDKVLMTHSEGPTMEKAIALIRKFGNKLHLCHVSQKSEVEMIKKAKGEGLDITCEVGMHHLYLTQKDVERLGHFGMMRPPLATEEDRLALWNGIHDRTIDTIASDHAPHTKEEKAAETVVNGVPGLETSLPLLLNAVNEGKLKIERVIELTHTKPREIFDLPEQENTYVEVDMDQEWEISNLGLFTKCHWTPFDGMKIKGKVVRTVLGGQIVFEDGKITGEPKGVVLFPKSNS